MRSARATAGAAVVLAVAAGGVTAWQLEERAEAAHDRTRRAAADAHQGAVEAAEAHEARRLEVSRAHAEARERRVAATDALAVEVRAAEDVLTASAGEVADDAVRIALTQVLDAARAAAGGSSAASLRGLQSAQSDLVTARDAVEAARAEWVTARDAALESAATPAPRPSATPTPPVATPAAPAASIWVTSIPTAGGDGSNGHMPASAMSLIPWGTDQIGSPQYLRRDAADALTRLNDAFRARFGEQIAMDLTYRSYADQVAIREHFGALAARPGTSSHGLGTALDVQEWPDVYGFGTERYDWLVANGPTYGWFAPAQVRAGAAYPEYWHFEYGPGRTS